jgi:photosystem II stability/assembly factor-like uncharacterized protein
LEINLKEDLMKLNYLITRAFYIVLFTLAMQCVSLGQGWNLLAPYPTNNALSSLSFINETTGWIAGSGDCILKTTDGGSTWSKQSTLTGQNLYAVYFADAQKGWTANDLGGISATTDGGNTWFKQAPSSSGYLYAMQFTDAQHGFVLFQSDSLLYTINGGTVWNRIKIDNTQEHYGIKFVNPNEGWICGSGGQILHSVNGGLNWTPQVTGTDIDLNAIDFTDNLHGWAAGYTNSNLGIVLITSNGGTTWLKLVEYFSDNLTRITFNDNNNGFAVSNSGIIYITANGGSTWTPAYTSPNEGLLDVKVFSSGTGYACGTSGAIIKTVNGGTEWSPIYVTATNGYTIRDLSFPNQDNGWLLDDASRLMHTANGGSVWTEQTPYPNSFATAAIYFSDANRGWVVGKWPDGGYGQILRTTNGGAAFNFQLNTGLYPFISVSFSDSLHGIAGTNNRMIYYTINGGTAWDSATVPSTDPYMQIQHVQLVDNTIGYALIYIVNKAAIAKTTDGGQTWAIIKTDNTQFTPAFTALSFVDAQNGYISTFDFYGNPNKFSLLKTTDGGASWTQLNFPSGLPGNIGTTQINALKFTDMQHGWVAGGGTLSFILHTDDGGSTWTTQELGTSVSWYTMKFIDSQTGYAAGWYGDIVKTTAGGVGIKDDQKVENGELTLFPNPAQETVVIHYPPAGTAKTEFKVFDIMGKEIYSGILTKSEVSLNLSPYPNGIYFIQVATGSQVITKKLIVSR